MQLPPRRKLNPDLLRYYLDAFKCAKVCGVSASVAVVAYAGGIAVGQLDSEEVQRFASLEAALRGYAFDGRTLGDLLDDPATAVQPPESES